jgi:lactoylglutathione lyase
VATPNDRYSPQLAPQADRFHLGAAPANNVLVLVMTSQSLFETVMSAATSDEPNVTHAVPLFNVTDIEASLRFYVNGLDFQLVRNWSPEGRLRWCWLERERVAVMLQQYWRDGQPGGVPAGPLGQGISICFMCADAIAVYHAAKARGLEPAQPFVGNGLWVTSFMDPDGYRLDFESPTDVAEESAYSAAQ